MKPTEMIRALGLLAATAVMAAGISTAAGAQTFPDPKDEAKLYEAAKKEGTLVWYGGAPADPMRLMANDFEAKYPGIKVEITRLVGVAQYQRYMQETNAKQYIVDLLHIGDRPSMVDLVENGYISEWKVPTYDRLPPDAKIKNHSYVAWIIDSAIAYNPNLVTPEEVKLLSGDYHGLLDPRFKGRLAITDQAAGGQIAVNQMFLSPKYRDEYGWPFLQKLAAQKLKIYNDVTIPVDRVVAGEQAITLFTSEGNTSGLFLRGAPIRWTHPKPVSAFGNTWFAVSKYATHPNAARLFINWIMSDEGARSVLTKYNGIPTLGGVKDDREVTKAPWYQPITERVTPDWDAWASGQTEKDFAAWVKLMKENQ